MKIGKKLTQKNISTHILVIILIIQTALKLVK
jgi:hypothetical protein